MKAASEEEGIRLAQMAYALLFDKTNSKYLFEVKYSKRFKDYNANAKKYKDKITFSLSESWKDTNSEIVIGLMQSLLARLEGKKVSSVNIDLYNNFIRNLHLGSTKKEFDAQLSRIFDDINSEYFNSMLEKPSLIWEGNAQRTLATYNYHDDTIRISNVFKDAPEDILRFLIYHESLHKLLKFKEKGSRTMHHTKQFRRLEAMFNGFEQMDERISQFLKSKNKKKTILSFIYDRI